MKFIVGLATSLISMICITANAISIPARNQMKAASVGKVVETPKALIRTVDEPDVEFSNDESPAKCGNKNFQALRESNDFLLHKAAFIAKSQEDLDNKTYVKDIKTFNKANAVAAGIPVEEFNKIIRAGVSLECDDYETNEIGEGQGWFLGEKNTSSITTVAHFVNNQHDHNRFELFKELNRDTSITTPCRKVSFADLLKGKTGPKAFDVKDVTVGINEFGGAFRRDWAVLDLKRQVKGAKSIPIDLDQSDVTPQTKFFMIGLKPASAPIEADGPIVIQEMSFKQINEKSDGLNELLGDAHNFKGFSASMIGRMKNGVFVASAMHVGAIEKNGLVGLWSSTTNTSLSIPLTKGFWNAIEKAKATQTAALK